MADEKVIMTADQEQRMRSELQEYEKSELIDLAISLQETVYQHVQQKGGFESSISLLNRQNDALRQANDQLEAEAAAPQADPEELQQLQEKCSALEARVIKLTELNEKLQAKLLGD